MRENLRITRETIDKYYGDTGRYPDSLTQLVDQKYLRLIPVDPVASPMAEGKILPPDDLDQGKVFYYQMSPNAAVRPSGASVP